MPLSMSRLTREYVFWDIDSPDDLQGATAEVAFLEDPSTLPDSADWEDAELVETAQGNWRFRALVGPDHQDSIDLTPSGSEPVDYETWTRLTDNPERIVRRPGVLTIL